MVLDAPAAGGRATDAQNLYDVHETGRLGPYISGLIQRREYMWFVAVNELRSRQMTSVLGNLWHLLNPALQIGVYYLIFGLLLEVNRGVDNFVAFLTVGIFMFGFTQRATTSGAKSIVSNRGLLNSLSFPRAMLPLTSTLIETLATVTPICILFTVAVLTGEQPSFRWLLLAPLLATQLVMNCGLAMIAARATNHVRDIQQLLPFVFRLLLYASGVIFNTEAYAESKYQWLFYGNPIYCVLTIARSIVLGGSFPPVLMLSLAIWTVALSVFGFLWFRSGEMDYGRD